MAKKAAKAAKRSRTQQAADQQQPEQQETGQQAAPSETIPVPGEKKVKSLSKELDDFQGQIDGLVGAKRERLANAKEKNGFHTKALADAKRMAKMPESLRRIYFAHLQHYLACLGVTDLTDSSQAEMFDEQLPAQEEVQQAAAENGADEGGEEQQEQTQHAGTAARFPSAVTH